MGTRPDTGDQRVEVRFAVGQEPIECKSFSLRVERSGKAVINGTFTSGFVIPAEGAERSSETKLRVRIACGKLKWYFRNVPSLALQKGWWWVGTDRSPFQGEFDGPKFASCRVIRFLMVDPTENAGFNYIETEPKTLEGSLQACTASGKR